MDSFRELTPKDDTSMILVVINCILYRFISNLVSGSLLMLHFGLYYFSKHWLVNSTSMLFLDNIDKIFFVFVCFEEYQVTKTVKLNNGCRYKS